MATTAVMYGWSKQSLVRCDMNRCFLLKMCKTPEDLCGIKIAQRSRREAHFSGCIRTLAKFMCDSMERTLVYKS